MALDGAFLYTVRNELLPLIGGRVEKIHQPSREEVIISIRTKSGSKKLYISANAGSARVHITENTVDNPQTPPMFCMLLRKRLGSGKLIDIRQDGLERILFLDFECVNELGDIVTVTLAVEIMGRCSNLIIVSGDGRVIDSIKRVDEEMSRERMVLPGMEYTLPPRDDRLNFLTCEPEDIKERLAGTQPKELSKALIRIFEGISPILAREWAYFAGRGAHIESDTISSDQLDRLLFTIKRTREQVLSGECCFSVVSDKEGQLKDFSFVRLSQFGTLMYTKELSGPSELLDYFYSERDRAARTKQRANDLFKLLMNLTDRTSRRIAAQREELDACADKDRAKLFGDLISANMYRIQKGDSSAVVENFYDEELFGEAMKVVDAQIAAQPNELRWQYLKITALLAYEKESPDMAAAAIKALIERNAKSHPAWTMAGEPADEELFQQGVAEYCASLFQIGNTGAYDYFREISEQMNKLYPKNPVFLDNIGSWWRAAKGNDKQAAKYYQKALKLDPDDYAAQRNLQLIEKNKAKGKKK